jgi:bifunctional non-homologous end joining protein LigD
VLYFVFDVMVLAGRDVMREPLEMRRHLLEKKILPALGEPVRYAAPLDASLPVLIESVKAQGLEGLVAKRLDSRYEAGLRSGAWQKMRVNRGQEFVIGGYTVGTKTFDALIFGYDEGDRLMYAARTRNGFTPVVREQLFKKFRGLETKDCPFVLLPIRREPAALLQAVQGRERAHSRNPIAPFLPTRAVSSLRNPGSRLARRGPSVWHAQLGGTR